MLEPLDDILTRLLVRLNINHEEALFHLNLAPLCTRRDIAQLGLIHRAVLRKGPPHLHGVFNRVRLIFGHSHQIYDVSVGRRQLYMRRSMFGLIAYYVHITNVNLFHIFVFFFYFVKLSVKRLSLFEVTFWATSLSAAPREHCR